LARRLVQLHAQTVGKNEVNTPGARGSSHHARGLPARRSPAFFFRDACNLEQKRSGREGRRERDGASAGLFAEPSSAREKHAPVAGKRTGVQVPVRKKTGPRRRCDEGQVSRVENRNRLPLQALVDSVKQCPFRARLGSQTQHSVASDAIQPAAQDRASNTLRLTNDQSQTASIGPKALLGKATVDTSET